MSRQVKVSKNLQKNWENDAIQFPRLISEMQAQGVFALPGVVDSLCSEMDISKDEVCGLIDRAEQAWEDVKVQLTKFKF